jgi:hypothetical protein
MSDWWDKTMKVDWIVLLILALSSVHLHAQINPVQIASGPKKQIVGSAIFQFGRTSYFRTLVNSQGCSQAYPERSVADETRFRAISARLSASFGAKAFNIDALVPNAAGSMWGRPCEEIALAGDEQKTSELAAWADRADGLNVQQSRP